MTMNGEPIAYCHNLYETFDDVCDALEEERKIRVDYDEKIKPNREEKLKEIQDWHNVLYYSAPNRDRFIIVKMNVIPKKITYEEQVNRLNFVKLDSGVLLMTPKK